MSISMTMEKPALQGAKPLAGIRVLDFTHAAAGPFASMFLADMGAEVIKVENPKGGDGSRSMGVPMPSHDARDSDYYVALNRNKRNIAIDLASPAGLAIAKELVSRCDVVLENFRPNVMSRLGLGFEQLRELRPGLVYASISAFGASGPMAERPANDIILQSVSGLMAITGEVGGGPVRIGAPISDYTSGLFMLSGVLAALYARERHPEGQHIEISMLDASLNLMCNYMPSVTALGTKVARVGRGHAQIVPYQAFVCADGEYLMVGAFTRRFWHNLCRALGHEEWISDPRYVTNAARLAHREELTAKLQALFEQKDRAEWGEILTHADVPNSPVYELHEAVRSEQVQASGSLISVGEGERRFQVARCPIRVDNWGPDRTEPARATGADTRAVLEDLLDMAPAEIDGLIESQAVSTVARGPRG